MHVSIIANGFQVDYITDFVNNLKAKVDKVDLIGTSIYSERQIDRKIGFYDLKGMDEANGSVFQKSLRKIQYFLRLVKYLHRTKATIIHVQWIRFYIIEGVLLTLYMRAIGKKVVYTVHDVLPHSEDNFYNRLIFKLIYKIHNQLVVHTSYIKSRIVSEFNINGSKIDVVPHGVYQRPDDVSITGELAKRHFGLSPSSTVILFFGGISEYKGFDILLESLSKIDGKFDLTVLVAGKMQEEYKNLFNGLLKRYKLDRYIFHIRYIQDDEIEYFFKASDVTVLPYKEASQSGVLFMSYAYGVPVIAPFLGGFPEDILPGKTGYLFEPNNPESLAKAFIKFKTEWRNDNINRHRDIKEFAVKNYSWEKTCDETLKIYQMLNV